ncbi:GNAT family N-acetyltransferase [Beijerinckia indica]|uniref:GCN5-related N-acetyltransferase n=1 Tax=Beijerinckia indica subsp. indica (strain ATCC 9039 / DSM 1715 / NCIMB 8712) TaxID=395963 RepID=B2IFM5_BEII9|nr:GNAT family N-acetyltransferase [Beijerinckia indica]ACB94236.1 GCN5-related N-acetyltransferase [Beijerinckia indica subsp. indica ATCC 9039]
MIEAVITIRAAREKDAEGIAAVHDAAWRDAYRGIIPGRELERMITRRGPVWWHSAIVRGSRLLLLEWDDTICGYTSYGRNRVPSMPYGGEIFELYIAPEFQGVGFGKRLFQVAGQDLAAHGYANFLVWALADNERGVRFYEGQGGTMVRQANERFGTETRPRIAFAFDNLPFSR